MCVYRCILCTTWQNPTGKIKTNYSESINAAHRPIPFLVLHVRQRHPCRPAYLPNFDQGLPNSTQMYVYRCTQYTRLQNPTWEIKLATLNQKVMHIGCHRSWKRKSKVLPTLRKGGVAPPSRYMPLNTSSSKVSTRLHTGGVAPHGDICEYIHLLGTYTCRLTAPFLLLHSRGGHPYRPAYLPNFDKRSLTISKCMSIGAHCIPHCKILIGKERPATLNETVMHICCNSSWKKKKQGVAHAAQGGCCPA